MHPPFFRIPHHLSDWQDSTVELHAAGLPVRLLIQRQGDLTLEALLSAYAASGAAKGTLRRFI
jgi:hypothetical protein